MLEKALENQGCNLVDLIHPDSMLDLLDLGLEILAHTACSPVNGVLPSASLTQQFELCLCHSCRWAS
jgi:hypothetical protein